MPFRSSKVQSKLLSTEYDDEPPSTPLSTYFALVTSYPELPSSFHSQPPSPSSPTAAKTPSSAARYLPSRAVAWWDGGKGSLAHGHVEYSTLEGIEDHGEEDLEQRDMFRKEKAMSVVEVVGLFLVIVALVGVMVLGVWMNMGIGGAIVNSGIRGKA